MCEFFHSNHPFTNVMLVIKQKTPLVQKMHQGRIKSAVPPCFGSKTNPYRNTGIFLTTDVCLTSTHLTPPSAGHITQFPTRVSHRHPLSFDGNSAFSLPHRFFCIVAPQEKLVNTFCKKNKRLHIIIYLYLTI